MTQFDMFSLMSAEDKDKVTQGLKGSVERSRIPKLFCEHIVNICEEAEETE